MAPKSQMIAHKAYEADMYYGGGGGYDDENFGYDKMIHEVGTT